MPLAGSFLLESRAFQKKLKQTKNFPMKNPALLLRQLWLLAAFAGIFASRHFPAAAVCLLLLVLLQQQRIFGLGLRFALPFLAGMLLCFAGGGWYAVWRAKPLPVQPEWLREAVSPTAQHLKLAQYLEASKGGPLRVWDVADNRFADDSAGIEKDGVYRAGLRLAARVVEVDGRDDRNLRLILENIRRLDVPEEVWPGRLVFTWNHALTPEGRKPEPPGSPVYLRRDNKAPQPELLAARPLPGQELELALRLRDIRSLRNHGLWETESYWADRGVGLRAWEFAERPQVVLLNGQNGASASTIWRENWRQGVLKTLPRKAGGSGYLSSGAELIPAFLFGDKYLLDSSDSELFARSTLAHSLALSGLHLGYAAALGYFAVSLLYRAFPALALRLPRRKAAVLGGTFPAMAYLWLGGAPPSLLRAAMMLLFVGWVLFRNRPLVLADALIWAVAAILLLDPLALFDLRLQLSALCIAALAWAQPLFGGPSRKLASRRGASWKAAPMRFLRALALVLLSTLVIQIILAPLLVKTFGLFGLAMPLNALWLPVLGLVVMPCAFLGLLAVILHLPGLAEVFLYIATLPCGWLLELLRGMDSSGSLAVLLPMRPHWLAMLGYWLALGCLPIIISAVRQRKITFGLSLNIGLALVLLLTPAIYQLYENSRAQVRLRLLDVGQGQSVLLEWGGKRLLLDGGGGSNPSFDLGREVVAATLTTGRLPKLDYMLASHLDQDHAQGLIFPLRHLQVGYYADNGEKAKSRIARELVALVEAQGLERHNLLAGDRLYLGNRLLAGERLDLDGGLVAEVLHPAEKSGDGAGKGVGDGNKNSLVVRFVWQGRGLAIVCGDVDVPAQRAILRRMADKGGLDGTLQADVLLLPHHGSYGSLLPAFYSAVAPKLALAATGYGNSWNFPTPKVKNTLLGMRIPLLSTARCGQLQLLWRNPQVTPSLNSARWGELSLE